MPVTRTWSIPAVMAALNASDVPREVILLLDAPHCDAWIAAFVESGWTVHINRTGNPEPPVGRFERRARHLAMRHITQKLTKDLGRVLYIEDDTLIPPDTWTRLSALMDLGYYSAASGVQRGRHEHPLCGVWRYDREAGIMEPYEPVGVSEADAVGHYCLMTTGWLYAALPIAPGPDEPVDCAHTRQMAPIVVDAGVWCGHLLSSGEIIL